MFERFDHDQHRPSWPENESGDQATRGERPDITVITVTLNSASVVSRAIESVLAQAVPGLEYVVIDGASRDETRKIVESYRDRFQNGRLRVLSEPDAGLYDAMNKGIALASGDVVGILNSDDRLLPGALDAICDAFRKTNADVVFGDVIVEGVWGSRTLKSTETGLDVAMTIAHPGCFVRRSAYGRWGTFDTTLRTAADYELLLRFREAGARFVRVDRVVAVFSEGGASSKSFSLAKEMFRVHRRHFPLTHAVKHAAVRFALATYLTTRRAVGRLILGENRYARIRERVRGSTRRRSIY